uniref:Uncharacterized protein n=1 Tax=Panagrolaimus sp. PS1159 TaxID=55785 RepID=A0AC35G3E1_9BILA
MYIDLVKTENSTISCDSLVPRLLSQLQTTDKAFNPPTFAELETAFHTILEQCPEGLTKEKITQLLTSRGEPLNDVEMAEMISHLPIRKNKIMDWKAYCRDIQMTIEEKQKIDKQ